MIRNLSIFYNFLYTLVWYLSVLIWAYLILCVNWNKKFLIQVRFFTTEGNIATISWLNFLINDLWPELNYSFEGSHYECYFNLYNSGKKMERAMKYFEYVYFCLSDMISTLANISQYSSGFIFSRPSHQ